jgi:hypothetical protein
MGFGVTQSSLPGADKRPSVQAKVRVLGSDGNFRTTQLLSTSHVIAATPSGRHILIEGSGCKGGEAFGAYLCDVQTGQGSGLLPQHVRRGVTLSDDASHLAFHTNRDGVVPFDNNGRYDVFGYEFASGRIRALNVGPEGWLGDAAAYLVETTNTRAYFISSASDLLPGAGGTLLYASDRATGRLSVESVDSTGAAVPILAAAAARGGAALAYRLATGEWVHRSLADSRIVPLLGEGDAAAASRLTLASDGASAFYQTRAADEHQAWKVVPGGAPVRINRDEANQPFPFLSEMVPSANGRYVAFQEDTPAGSLYRVVDTTNGATRYALVV